MIAHVQSPKSGVMVLEFVIFSALPPLSRQSGTRGVCLY